MNTEVQNLDARPLPRKEFYSYAIGYAGPMTAMALLNILLVNYYYYVIGLDGTLSGLGMTIGLALLSFLSLYFGNMSDNFTGKIAQKRGRRMPFLFWGTIGMAISFILVWFPPTRPATTGIVDWGTTAWYWIFTAIFHICLAAVSPAYWALLAEISHKDTERMQISIVQNLLNLIATIISIIVPVIFLSGSKWNDSLWYGTPSGVGENIITQMIFYSILFSILAIITIGITVTFVKEPPFRIETQEKRPFIVVLKEIVKPLRRKDLAWFMVSTFLINITMRILFTDILIFVRVVLQLDGSQWYWFAGIVAGCGVLSFLGWDKISNKLGLKKAFLWVLAVAGVVLLTAVMFLPQIGLTPEVRFPTGIALTSIGVVALVGMMIFLTPILSSLIDKHKKTVTMVEGDKLAGKYNGINSFVTNISQAIANLLYGSIIAFFPFEDPVASVILLPISGIFIVAGYFTFKKVEMK